MGFSRGGSSNYNRMATNSSNGTSLSYNIYKTNNTTNILKTLDDATSTNQVLVGTINKNETKTFAYYFTLGALGTSTLPRAGTYTDTVLIAAYPGILNATDSLEITNNLAVSITIPKNISISLINSGGDYDATATTKTLDFGELTEGEELGLDVRVLSNAGYQLSVSSANNQVLQLVGSTASTDTQIGYDFYFNGVAKNLSTSKAAPVTLVTGSGATAPQGVAFPIRVVIKTVDNKTFGTYQDYITFTVATTE
jgi:hypothetical protein